MTKALKPQSELENNMNILNNQKGIAAFLVIVMISAVALIMAYSAAILGLGEIEMGFDSQQGGQAFALADGCIEEAMRRLRLDTDYTGSSLSFGANSCIISVTGAGSNRTIYTTSTVGEYYKKIEAQVSFTDSPTTGVVLSLDSWEESDQ